MRPTVALLALALLGPTLSGCLGDDPVDEDGRTAATGASALPLDWWRDAMPWGGAHEHAGHAHHEGLTTPNFHVVGYDPLVTEGLGTTTAGMGCGGAATRDDGRRLAVAHGFSSPMGFVVADVTDPAHPALVGEFYLPNVDVWDATITADGQHVLVAADPQLFPARVPELPPVGGVTIQPQFRNACTGEVEEAGPESYVPYGPSVMLVGIQDPANPVIEDVVPQPVLGPHSVSSQLIDGTVYAISSVTNLVHEASYYTFFEVLDTPTGARLETLTVIQAPGSPDGFNGHVEAELHKHPGTGQVLAYLANWDAGLVVYDMSEPRLPVHLSTWTEPSGLGNFHSVVALDELRNGRHYTIVGQEISEGSQDEPGLVFILDTTDPNAPEELSRWTFPDKPTGWDWSLQFSTHYFDVFEDILFVASYHAGLWAVDIGDIANPAAVGVFVPDRVSPSPPEPPAGRGPNVEDVIADADGTLTAWDGDGGIYQLRFDASVDAPHAPTWYSLRS